MINRYGVDTANDTKNGEFEKTINSFDSKTVNEPALYRLIVVGVLDILSRSAVYALVGLTILLVGVYYNLSLFEPEDRLEAVKLLQTTSVDFAQLFIPSNLILPAGVFFLLACWIVNLKTTIRQQNIRIDEMAKAKENLQKSQIKNPELFESSKTTTDT